MPTATAQPAGWAFSTALVGPTAPLTSPTDNPNLWNLTWTYSGSAIPGSAALGTFSAVTSTDQLKTRQVYAPTTPRQRTGASSQGRNLWNGYAAIPPARKFAQTERSSFSTLVPAFVSSV